MLITENCIFYWNSNRSQFSHIFTRLSILLTIARLLWSHEHRMKWLKTASLHLTVTSPLRKSTSGGWVQCRAHPIKTGWNIVYTGLVAVYTPVSSHQRSQSTHIVTLGALSRRRSAESLALDLTWNQEEMSPDPRLPNAITPPPLSTRP